MSVEIIENLKEVIRKHLGGEALNFIDFASVPCILGEGYFKVTMAGETDKMWEHFGVSPNSERYNEIMKELKYNMLDCNIAY